MGVYIDMEMPTSCGECPMGSVLAGYKCLAKNKQFDRYAFNSIQDWCPLIEVPEPHGRLGDLDAIEKQIDYIANLQWNIDVGASGGMLAALEVVEDAQTIIPASTE